MLNKEFEKYPERVFVYTQKLLFEEHTIFNKKAQQAKLGSTQKSYYHFCCSFVIETGVSLCPLSI